jgi:hypothetical protein
MPTTTKDFATILAERQAYIDTLKTQGDVYALSYLENSFLYDCGNYGLSPLTTAQHSTLAKWKEATK